MAEQGKPVTLTRYWQPTGRTRMRSGWFGFMVIEVQQQRVALVAKVRQVQTRWRRAPRGLAVTFCQGGALVRAHAVELPNPHRYDFVRRG